MILQFVLQNLKAIYSGLSIRSGRVLNKYFHPFKAELMKGLDSLWFCSGSVARRWRASIWLGLGLYDFDKRVSGGVLR